MAEMIQDKALSQAVTMARQAFAAGALEPGLVFAGLGLALDPAHGRLLAWAAGALGQQGLEQASLNLGLRAVTTGQDDAPLWRNLALAARGLGDSRRRAFLERVVHHAPDDDATHLALAILHHGVRDMAAARRALAHALALAPGLAQAWVNAAAILAAKTGQAAEKPARRARHLAPLDGAAWTNWGLSEAPRHGDPDPLLRLVIAVALAPDFTPAWHNLGHAVLPAGQARLALACYTRALHLDPSQDDAWHTWLFHLHYPAEVTDHTLEAAHRAFGARHRTPIRPLPRPGQGRRLKLGFVSGDVRRHSVAFFLKPTLEGFARDQVHLTLYSNNSHRDSVTDVLAGLADRMIEVAHLSDDAVADQIRKDEIDLLIDLSGHTGGQRLGVFARRPAPLSATWLGYPNTTGLGAIDLRLTDALCDPWGECAWASEDLVRVEGGFLAYQQSDMVAPAVFDPQRPVTFGCFNNLAKVTKEQARAFTAIVQAVKGARLVLKSQAFDQPKVREAWFSCFEDFGLGRDRVDLWGWAADGHGHLAAHHVVDIALDTYPYAGTTTTCDALWMGVPVISRVGARHASRVGLSLLDRVGLGDLAVEGEAAFIAKAVDLAGDVARRAALRARLRADLIASPLSDGARLARAWHRIASEA